MREAVVVFQARAEEAVHADVSEFGLRMPIQKSASPFAISNAVRVMWLSTRYPPFERARSPLRDGLSLRRSDERLRAELSVRRCDQRGAV